MQLQESTGLVDESVNRAHPQTLYIPNSLIVEMKEHARSSPTKEVCGLIVGTDDHALSAETYFPIKNISNNPRRDDYIMDPQESMNVLKDTQIIPYGEHKFDLVGIFHSHPMSTPYPSSIDIRHAAYNVAYVIYSMLYNKMTFQIWDGSWFVPLNIGVL